MNDVTHRTFALQNLNGTIRFSTHGAKTVHVVALNPTAGAITVNLEAFFGAVFAVAPIQLQMQTQLVGAGAGRFFAPLTREAVISQSQYLPDVLLIQTTGPMNIIITMIY